MTRSRRIGLAILIALFAWVGGGFYAAARQARLRKELTAAVSNSDVPAVRRLLAEGADPNAWQGGDPPPTWRQRFAAAFGRGTLPPRHRGTPILDMSLTANYEIEANTEIARLLLEHGADPNASVDIDGFSPSDNMPITPLGFALEKGSPALVALLLEHGSAVNAQGMTGQPVLIEAVGEVSPDALLPIVGMLITHKADINARDTQGHTVLWNVRHYDVGEIDDDTRKKAGAMAPRLTALLIRKGAKE